VAPRKARGQRVAAWDHGELRAEISRPTGPAAAAVTGLFLLAVAARSERRDGARCFFGEAALHMRIPSRRPVGLQAHVAPVLAAERALALLPRRARSVRRSPPFLHWGDLRGNFDIRIADRRIRNRPAYPDFLSEDTS